LIHAFTFFVTWHIHWLILAWEGHSNTFSKWIIYMCSIICILRVYLVKSCTHPYLCTCVFPHLYLERDSNVYENDKTSQSTCVTWCFMYAFIFVAWKMIKPFLFATGLIHMTKNHWYVIHVQDTLTVFLIHMW